MADLRARRHDVVAGGARPAARHALEEQSRSKRADAATDCGDVEGPSGCRRWWPSSVRAEPDLQRVPPAERRAVELLLLRFCVREPARLFTNGPKPRFVRAPNSFSEADTAVSEYLLARGVDISPRWRFYRTAGTRSAAGGVELLGGVAMV